jgi:hypothetical protein
VIEEVTRDDFASCVNTEFALAASESKEHLPDLTLSQVSDLRSSGPFETFSLLFQGPGDQLLPQQIYPLQHPRLGSLEIFLVPVSRDQAAIYYEAVFTRTKPAAS